MEWRALLVIAITFASCLLVESRDCPNGFFSCTPGDKSSCLRNVHRCDGVLDCNNGNDEEDCDTASCEEPDFISCRNGNCISSFFRCDGENDCGDYSDEDNCGSHQVTSAPAECSSEEWRCTDNMCIPSHWVCDGKQDCLDGSDELQGCSLKLECEDGFLCTNKQCIVNEWVCDDSPDCSDGSDEKDCGTSKKPGSPKNAMRGPEVASKDCTLDHGLFLCQDTLTCLEFKEVCNGATECLDGSDEGSGCDIDVCSAANCSTSCLKTPQGPVCYCPTGYELGGDKTSCIDKNECAEFGVCSQKCLNTLGSYKCLCDSGYKLEDDEHSCKALGGESMLFYSSKKDVRGLFLSSNVKFSVGRNKLKHVVGVAYDGLNVYWTSVVNGEEAIVKSKEDGSEMEAIITAGVSLPEDVALDWLTGNVYFSDSQEHHIAVCTNDGSLCKVLITEDMEDNPRAVALLVNKGLMFWSRWGKSPGILSAGMDGSNPRGFVTKNIAWPNGIAFDYPNDRLYWVDSKLRNIESVHLDGSDRRMVLKKVVQHPYSIAVFENSLYWSDFEDREIYRCDKFTGKHVRSVVKERKNYIYDVHVYHSAAHADTPNPCLGAECSDICLLAPNQTYACACPEGKELMPDRHLCMEQTKKDVLVVGAGRKLFEIYHQALGRQHIFEMKPKSVGEIGALTYNSVTGNILISDISKKKIYSLNLVTNTISTVVNATDSAIEAMDFDHLGNNLYWCDSARGSVEVLSLTTLERTTVLRDIVPLGVAVIPEEGVMFVAMQGLDGPHIDRYNMDGSGIGTHVIEGLLVGPSVALSYDSELHRVFFADSGRATIESTDADGTDLHSYKTVSGTPAGIASIGTDMFWVTSHDAGFLYWSNKYAGDGKDKRISLDIDEKMERVKVVAAGQVRSKSPHICHNNNGGCSHLCLISKKSAVCGCPVGMRLQTDAKTCVFPLRCGRDEFKCKTDELCIEAKQRCDKTRDCPSGEDEEGCDENKCAANEHYCTSGECIRTEKRCDGRSDCRDGSDEQNCITKQCGVNEYQCASGQCILAQWRCDMAKDCTDGSDEEACDQGTCQPREFRCQSGSCIPASWECDGRSDCYDSSDEHSGCSPPACRRDERTCKNGRCVATQLVCNAIDDCGDNSDEEDCVDEEMTGREAAASCPTGHFFCSSAPDLCPLEENKCNGVPDCPKGEDERNCGCPPQQFECSNGKCISLSWRCDGFDDCADGSDESAAQCNVSARVGSVGRPCNDFSCGSGECVKLEEVCDGKDSCKDGSDEGGKCATACSSPQPCGGLCLPTPNGPRCSCSPGFVLNGTSCLDVDECAKDICSQFCVNTPGSYYCTCDEGYRMRSDKRSCKATGGKIELLFAAGYEVRQTRPDMSHMDILMSDPGRMVAGLDVDAEANQIYFSNRLFGTVTRLDLNSKEETVLINVGQPGRLALDWVNKNVYVVDEGTQETIKVCNFDSLHCSKIVYVELPTKVSSLVVDPKHKYLFWAFTSYWAMAPPTATVYRSNLLGTEVAEIVDTDLSLVTGLALDFTRRQVYIADQMLQKVDVVNYDGSQRRVVFRHGIQHPIALAMFEDYLFWLGSGSGQIGRCRVLGLPPRKCDSIPVHAYNAEHLVVMQQARQPPVLNVCANHTCATVCVPRADTPLCVCGNGSSVNMGDPCSEMPAKRDPEVTAAESTSQSGVWTGLILSLVFLSLILAAFWIYRYRTTHGKLSVSMHFKNPSFGFNPKDIGTTMTDELKPGEHQYGNPMVAISQNPSGKNSISNFGKTSISNFGKNRVAPIPASFPDPDSETESICSTDNDRMRLVH